MNIPSITTPLLAFALLGGAGVPDLPAQEASPPVLRSFKRILLSDQFWCEGAAFADLNNDGKQDIAAGPWWWEGPDFGKRHEIYAPAATFQLALGEKTQVTVPGFEGGLGKKNTYSDNFFVFPQDFNVDGWMDLLVVGFPGQFTSWFENPKEGGKPWRKHRVFPQTDNESPTFADLTGMANRNLSASRRGLTDMPPPTGAIHLPHGTGTGFPPTKSMASSPMAWGWGM